MGCMKNNRQTEDVWNDFGEALIKSFDKVLMDIYKKN